MGKITVERCFCGGLEIEGLRLITPAVYGDERGWFMETYNQRDLVEAGICETFVQDNQSMSRKGVLRGLHFQKQFPQGKLVRVLRGAVLDVALDLRKGSKTFGLHYAVELSEHNRRQLYIPRGFAHGFYVLSDTTEFAYKCTDFYRPDDEGGILYSDAALGIDWRLCGETPIVSEKDLRWLPLCETEL